MLLGVTIDNNLTFSLRIQFALSKICARKIARPAQNSTLRLNFMRRLFSPNLTIVISPNWTLSDQLECIQKSF